jgi:hypothetical protein
MLPGKQPPIGRRWLLLVHQLPSEPSNVRVRTWRRLRQLGAVSVKQAVSVLPESPAARDAFQRLGADIVGAGGDVSVFSAASVDAGSDQALVEAFRQSRERDYGSVARDVEKALRGRPGRGKPPTRPAARQLEQFRQRLGAAERLDFFDAPGRDRAVLLLQQLAARVGTSETGNASRSARTTAPAGYRGRVWVTRPRPGVDRMASAWLIRRFIDPEARFAFETDRRSVPAEAIPFDMSEVEFSHHDGGCTYETLCDRFGIRDDAVSRIAAIVHDLDLKDDRFRAPETPTIGAVIQGLQLAHATDEALLEHGMHLFEALYRSPGRGARPGGSDFRRTMI